MFSSINLNITKECFFFIEEYRNTSIQIVNTDCYRIVLFKNNCICRINFKNYKVSKNGVLFLGPRDSFFCEEQELEIVVCVFNKKVFAQDYCKTENLINGLLFNNLFQNFILEVPIKKFQKFRTKIIKIIKSIKISDYSTAETLFKEIILIGLTLKHKLTVDKNQSLNYYKIAYEYLSLIHQHFRMEHNVFIYAQILRVQPKFLTKVFFDLKVENPKHFLNERILLAAKNLLIYTSDTATSISYDIGFNEPAYFNRFFKKNTGLTTKQFRRKEISIKRDFKKKNVH